MQRELSELFESFERRSDWVFCKEDGLPYEHWHLDNAFEKVLKGLGIDTAQYSWKELRHTTVSLMHLKGAPPLAIKGQLRHTTLKTTESFYIGADVEYQRSQVEKIMLDRTAEA